MSAFETERYELTSNPKFIPNATTQDPNFIDIFLDIILAIVTHFKNVPRENINELMKIIDARPVNGYYIFTLGQTAKVVRILLSILKRNFEEFNAVERTIQRLISEIDFILKSKAKNKSWLEWTEVYSVS